MRKAAGFQAPNASRGHLQAPANRVSAHSIFHPLHSRLATASPTAPSPPFPQHHFQQLRGVVSFPILTRETLVSPQAYANTVSAHAHNHTIETSIYPGPHFDRLASYLQRPFEDRGRRIPASALAAPTTKPFVFIYHYVHLGHDNATPAELTFPQDVLQQPDANAKCDAKGGLVFMRGLPSSEWLVNLGATYRVDPEFFQRHLDFFSTAGRINHYPPVSMPSSSSYMVELRYMTIAKQGIFEPGITPEKVQRLRADAKAETNTYLTGLSSSIDRDEESGSSVVRGVWVFNSGHLVIEQAMSLCVNRSDGPWTGMPLFFLTSCHHEPRLRANHHSHSMD